LNKAAAKANNSAEKQRLKMNEIQARLNNMQDKLVEESHLQFEYELQLMEQTSSASRKIKHESRVGLRGGSGMWSEQVILLICELLVNGVSPAAIPNTLQARIVVRSGKNCR